MRYAGIPDRSIPARAVVADGHVLERPPDRGREQLHLLSRAQRLRSGQRQAFPSCPGVVSASTATAAMSRGWIGGPAVAEVG